jgi:hypothetical protein
MQKFNHGDLLMVIPRDNSQTFELAEAVYCDCGELCGQNRRTVTFGGGRMRRPAPGQQVVIPELGGKVTFVADNLPECGIGEGWDEGVEGAREITCEVCA